MSNTTQLERKEARHLRSETAWLQKAMFALTKAEASHEKYADLGEGDGECKVKINGRKVSLSDINEALEARVGELREMTRDRRY